MSSRINIFKDYKLYNTLSQYNKDLIDIGKKYVYGNEDKWAIIQDNFVGSSWFNTNNVKTLPLSRTYPNNDPIVSAKEEYNLILYVSNYLTLFLINLLYKDKNICIEEFGCGVGWLIYYLSRCGYNNFSVWDDWSQGNNKIFLELTETYNIPYQLNNINTNPTVVNNVGTPGIFITHGIDATKLGQDGYRDLSNLELICFYSNRIWKEKYAPVILTRKGYRYLCEDEDNLALAYCREDKYEEFKGKIEQYEI